MARTVTNNYKADGPPPVSGGSIADSTWFAYADNDSDPFSREQDLYYLALALERHDHRNGRGLSVGRIDAGAIDASALGNNSVGSSAIADGAVGTTELADNAVTTAKILDGTIKGVDMEPTAIVDRLGYTPINKAGDIDIGPLTLGKVGPPTTSATLTFLNDGGITLSKGAINSNGSISIDRGAVAGTVAMFKSSMGGEPLLVLHNSDTNNTGQGYSLGILNKATSNWELLFSHAQAGFAIPIASSVAQGTAPISVSSTTVCPNLNVQYLGGHPYTDFILGSSGGAVPPGVHAFFQTAALIATGWARASSTYDGRLLVTSGTSFSVNFPEGTLQGGDWTHGHDLRSHQHGMTDHTHGINPSAGSGSFQPGTQGVALSGTALGGTPSNNNTSSHTFAGSFPTYALVLAYKT